MYHWPMSHARDIKVRSRMNERLLERSKDNREYYRRLPGMDDLRGRELLAWFREKDLQWWLAIAAEFPDKARELFMTYGSLRRRYG